MMPFGAGVEPNYWLSCVLLDPALPAGREEVRLALEELNIEARAVWKPLHLQPVYRDAPTVGGRVAEGIFERGLCLPSGTALSAEDQERIIETVLRVIGAGAGG